ncbi:uncharacterized protein [Montipora foliosa]|uniref:uncharacterized protein isoform X3 n=1 Tax=Montipora foliosa TaxID=591990 RepID=UPI0035F19512
MLLVYMPLLSAFGVLVVQGDSSPYGPWTEWSECSVDKGRGVMSRTRACVAIDCPQPGEYEDVMACFVIPCPCECPLAHTGGLIPSPTQGAQQASSAEKSSPAAPRKSHSAAPKGSSTSVPEKVSTTAAGLAHHPSKVPTPAEVPCEDHPLGAAEGGKLPSSSFTASSSSDQYFASNGRLNGSMAWCSEEATKGEDYLQIHLPEAEEICAIATQGNGYKEGHEYVTLYILEFSNDSYHWEAVEEDGSVKVFNGNKDSKTTSKQVLEVPVKATYIRITPLDFKEWPCLRVEIYGKEKPKQQPYPGEVEEGTSTPTTSGAQKASSAAPRKSYSAAPKGSSTSVPEKVSTTAAGLAHHPSKVPTPAEVPCEDHPLGAAEGGKLPSSSFTASSSSDQYFASNGRLNGSMAWCSEEATKGEDYLQIHLPEAEEICAIATQGNGYKEGHEYVTLYILEFSNDSYHWEAVEEDGSVKVFNGNKDSKTTSKQVLEVPVKATYIRITPLDFKKWPCLRVEIYGKEKPKQQPYPGEVEEGTSTPTTSGAQKASSAAPRKSYSAAPKGSSTSVPKKVSTTAAGLAHHPSKVPTAAEIPCADHPLGAAEGGKLPSSSFTASSSSEQYFASNGRLNGSMAWCSEEATKGEDYLQIHLPEAEEICAIATQGNGYKEGHEYVTLYILEFSNDSYHWEAVEEDGSVKVFNGNKDSKTTSKQVLEVPVKATYIRITPLDFKEWPCLRVEIYGKGEVEEGTSTPTTSGEVEQGTSSPTTSGPPPPPPPCKEHLDVGIILDSSSSIQPNDYQRALSFLQSLVDRLDISERGTHMAILLYSWEAHTVYRFTDPQNVTSVKNKIRSLPHIEGGTRTDKALELAGEHVFGWEETGDRPDVPNVVVVLTDGNTNEASKPFSEVLPSLEFAKVRRIAVGIGNDVHRDELEEIAGTSENVIEVLSYGDLISNLENITDLACANQHPGSCGAWGAYGSCSKTCGSGFKIRQRSCPGNSLHLTKQKAICNSNLCPGQQPCQDTLSNCTTLAAAGQCWKQAKGPKFEQNFTLWNRCEKSCRRCDVDPHCQDSDPYRCPMVIAERPFRCSMLKDKCRKSCGTCGAKAASPTTSAAEEKAIGPTESEEKATQAGHTPSEKPKKQPHPEVPCKDHPLGAAEGGKLPNSNFAASSSYSPDFASNGRLNGPKAWCAEEPRKGEDYLEIHVPEAEEICAIATQGSSYDKRNEYVTFYSLEFSNDGYHWEDIKENGSVKVFTGNEDSQTASKQVMEVPVKATYIRITPLEFQGWPCLRVEIYGKEKPKKQPHPGQLEQGTLSPTSSEQKATQAGHTPSEEKATGSTLPSEKPKHQPYGVVTTISPETPSVPECKAATQGIDLAILIDSSSGGNEERFEKIKLFISQLVVYIRTRIQQVQLGFIVYSDKPELAMTLRPFDDVDVSEIIQGIKYTPGGHRIDLAMLKARLDLFCCERCQDSLDYDNIMVVFTSGNTNPESKHFSLLSPIIKNVTSNVIAVGLNSAVSKTELIKIALGHSDHVIKLQSPEHLDFSVIAKIGNLICEVEPRAKDKKVEVEPTTGRLVILRNKRVRHKSMN